MEGISRPSNRTDPATISRPRRACPSSAWATVVLPEPDSPTRPRISPASTWNETSATTSAPDDFKLPCSPSTTSRTSDPEDGPRDEPSDERAEVPIEASATAAPVTPVAPAAPAAPSPATAAPVTPSDWPTAEERSGNSGPKLDTFDHRSLFGPALDSDGNTCDRVGESVRSDGE